MTKCKRRVASIAPASLALILCSTGLAHAGSCTVAETDLADGQTTVCSGAFSEQSYSITRRNIANATIINNGDWVETGSVQDGIVASGVIGPSRRTNTDYTGLTIINNGSITWTNANRGTIPVVTDRTLSAMGSYYATNTDGSTYINNGSITLIGGAADYLLLSGIGQVGRDGQNISQNSGDILVDSRLGTFGGEVAAGMLTSGGVRALMQNSGSIDVLAGASRATGMMYQYLGPPYTSGSVTIENTGSIDSTSDAIATGISLWDFGSAVAPVLSDVTIVNSGTITATGTTTGIGVEITSDHPAVPVRIENSGTITGSDFAILNDAAASTTPVEIDNTGTLNGDVTTAAGDDIYDQTGGALNGALSLGDGSDAATFAGGADLSGVTALDGGDDLSGLDGMIDTLTFAGLDADIAGGLLQNWENIVIDTATLRFSDAALATGGEPGLGLSLINGGVASAGGAFALSGNLNVGAGGRYAIEGAGLGAPSISGDVSNAGTISLSDGAAGDVLSVGGTYTGNGGVIVLDSVMGDDSAASDRVVIAGDVSGQSGIWVNPVGGRGAQTNQGILLVDVGGASAANAFRLANSAPLEFGAYVYDLGFGDPGDPANQNWYLRSTGAVGSTGAIYESAPGVLLSFGDLPTLEQRVGQRQWWGRDGAGQDAGQPGEGAWIRASTTRASLSPSKTDAGASYDLTSWQLQAGVDALVADTDHGHWVLGGTVHAGTLNASVSNAVGDGDISGEGIGVGLTGTWYGDGGTYVDLQSQITRLRSDYDSDAFGTLKSGDYATALALSAEVGHRFALSPTGALVPQAQLSWSRLSGTGFTDRLGNKVDFDDATRLIGRLGLAYEFDTGRDGRFGPSRGGAKQTRKKAYVIANILHDFSPETSVSLGGVGLDARGARSWAEIGVGGSVNWDKNKTFFVEGSYRTGLGKGGNRAMSLSAGFRMTW